MTLYPSLLFKSWWYTVILYEHFNGIDWIIFTYVNNQKQFKLIVLTAQKVVIFQHVIRSQTCNVWQFQLPKMECHHVVTNGPIVSTVHHEALVAMDTVIAHKITRCPTYLKPYQHFTIRLSRSKQDDNFLFDKMQRSPLNISILIKGEDGTTLQVLNTVHMLYVYSVARVHFAHLLWISTRDP